MVSKLNTLLIALALAVFMTAGTVLASFYGEEDYSYCVYNWIDECPDELDPLNPIGKGGEEPEEEEEEPDSVSADVDEDQLQELAIDYDFDINNGYESYEDSDGSSQLFVAADGDGDGQVDFLIYSVESGTVKYYWDPDDGVLGLITIRDIDGDGFGEYIFDSDGNGVWDAYYDAQDDRVYRLEINKIENDIDDDRNNEKALNKDLDDRNGFEQYVDDDQSTSLYKSIDGDRDGRIDFLITKNTANPVIYWDPDINIVTAVISANVDEDTPVEFVFDSDDDGLSDKYYDRETDQVYDYEIPGERRYTSDGFGGFLYQGLGNFLRGLSFNLARWLPMIGLWLIGSLAVTLFLRGNQELNRTNSLKRFVDEDNRFNQEKSTFIGLISHYMRTPMTVISGYVEMIESKNRSSEMAEIKTLSQDFTDTSEKLIEEVDGYVSQASQAGVMAVSQSIDRTKNMIYSIVVVAVGVLVAIIQFALADFRVISISAWLLIIVILTIIVATNLAVFLLRRQQVRKAALDEQKLLIEEKRTIEEAKENFIDQSVTKLKDLTAKLSETAKRLKLDSDTEKIKLSADELVNTVSKLSLANSLKVYTYVGRNDQLFPLVELINEQINTFSQKLATKEVAIEFDPKVFPALKTNRNYLAYILASVINNAIDYSKQNEAVSIDVGVDRQNNRATITISDRGKGINKTMLNRLFLPFSRVEGLDDFNHQGLGLNLYLSRLLARYISAELKIDSQTGRGTDVVITLPISNMQGEK